MTGAAVRSWPAVRAEVLQRIRKGAWKPGDLIPTEADLAEEFGCSRVTVNRALREIAQTGLLERRRKGGTRVARFPVRKAVLDIPIVRLEVEARGGEYSQSVLERRDRPVPAGIALALRLPQGAQMLFLRTLHMSDGEPYAYEVRWINTGVVPAIRSADLSAISANEWLVINAPLSTGDIAFSARRATAREAEILHAGVGAALFTVDRTTWFADRPVTSVRLLYAPGFSISTQI